METQSNIQQPLKEKLMSYRNLYAVKETTTNKSQFEKNNRAEYVIRFIQSICETMDEQYSLIGKQVVKFKKSTKYTTIEMYNNHKDVNKIWNKFEEDETTMTHEMYLDYEKWHVNYLIGYISEDLLERQITMHSTCQVSNIVFQWILEEKQLLIKYLKDISNND
jgi:hypothetical protein